MKWIDRAVNMEQICEQRDAPPDIKRLIRDSIQHFAWATDCRRQCYMGGGAKWRNKANKAHYHGKTAFNKVREWYLCAR